MQDPVSVRPAEPLEQDLVSVRPGEPHESDPVSVRPAELPARVLASIPPGEPYESDLLVPVPSAGSHDQAPVAVLGAGSLEPGLVSVPRAGSLEPGLVSVPLGDHEILSATLQPAHAGVVQKISGHNADLDGAGANRDTLAENSPSNADFVYTTHSTSEHTTD